MGWVFPNAQRVLGGLGTLALILPMLTVSPCNSSRSVTLTGFQVYTRDGLWPVLALELAVLVAVLAVPMRQRGAPLGQLSHAALFAAPIAAIVSYSLVVPFVGFMFQSPTPEIGAFLHGGLWTVLYVILGLTAMFKLRALFEHRPGWWGLVLGGSVFVAQIALATRAMAKEAELQALCAEGAGGRQQPAGQAARTEGPGAAGGAAGRAARAARGDQGAAGAPRLCAAHRRAGARRRR